MVLHTRTRSRPAQLCQCSTCRHIAPCDEQLVTVLLRATSSLRSPGQARSIGEDVSCDLYCRHGARHVWVQQKFGGVRALVSVPRSQIVSRLRLTVLEKLSEAA